MQPYFKQCRQQELTGDLNRNTQQTTSSYNICKATPAEATEGDSLHPSIIIITWTRSHTNVIKDTPMVTTSLAKLCPCQFQGTPTTHSGLDAADLRRYGAGSIFLLLICHTLLFATANFSIVCTIALGTLALHQRPATILLIVPHGKEGADYHNPIEVVRDDRAICCRIFPPEKSIEDTPSTTAVEPRVTTL